MYTVRESARAKYLRLTVYPDGRVVLTKPKRSSMGRALRFLDDRQKWIEAIKSKIERRQRRNPPVVDIPRLRRGTKAHKEVVERARKLVHSRLPYFAPIYNVKYNRVAIKSQKTLWGSCSRKGNLNFNYKIAFLPPDVADYLIVHELCHLIEQNHSPRFWAEVARTQSDPKTLRRKLRAVPL